MYGMPLSLFVMPVPALPGGAIAWVAPTEPAWFRTDIWLPLLLLVPPVVVLVLGELEPSLPVQPGVLSALLSSL
jgi:hypothetical protein